MIYMRYRCHSLRLAARHGNLHANGQGPSHYGQILCSDRPMRYVKYFVLGTNSFAWQRSWFKNHCVFPLRRPERTPSFRFDIMSEVDNNVAPPIGADDAPAEPAKARSRSPSVVSQSTLGPETGPGEARRKRRSSSLSQPPEGIVQAQVFNLDP